MAQADTDDWREQATIDVDLTAEVLGISKNGVYDAVRRGELSSIRIGSRILVLVVPLRRQLGEIT
jgi:excisionase family DNA binding protein